MTTTPKGIYYPNDYNEIADIPEDMKKMAESIDEVFENTDIDLSDIKEEQTTQNNRLNSLEVDNTTNKSDILTNKQEINNIKMEQTEQNTNISTNATNIESLQKDNENLKKIVAQLPQVTGQGTEVTLENTIEAPFTIFDVEGNSVQETTSIAGGDEYDSPSPEHEQPIYSAGDNGSINEKIQTRNVVPNNAISQIKNGVELIKNEDGSFTLNGTASANFDITFATNFTLKAGVYTSSIKQQIKKGLYYSFDNIADTMLNGNSGKRKTTFTLNADKTYSRAFLWIDNGTTFNNETYFIQTEPGSTATPYVSHEEQDYPIFVQQPMRSIGDVRDGFVKKSDGKLYERHLPYIASYNGETLPQDVYNEVDNVKYCNEKSMSTTGQFSIGASVQYIDENNWNDLPCTETQIQQLENKPSTYKEMTIINSEDETPAYLEVSGIYDLNKLITRVEVIESES